MKRPPKIKLIVSIDMEYLPRPFRFLGCGYTVMTPGGELTGEEGFLDDWKSFISFIRSAPRSRFYAHSGGRAEFLICLPPFLKMHTFGSASLVGGRILQMFAEGHEWRDSARLLPASIEAIGKAVGLEKTMLDYEHLEDEPAEFIRRAAINHSKILALGLIALARRLWVEVGRIGLTIGYEALRMVRRLYSPVLPSCDSPEYGAAARAALYGGRSEIYFRGELPAVRGFDRNSSYPASLAEGDVPWDNPGTCADLDRADIVTGEVIVPDQPYPPLPMRHDQTLFFPTGRFSGSFAGDELRYSIQECGVVLSRFDSGIRWTERLNCGGMVREIYNARALGGFEELYGKLMLNSLVGKFAQHVKPTMLEPTPGGWRIREKEARVRRLWHAAGCVLARARVALHRGLRAGHPAVMTDTDSVFTQRQPGELELNDRKLGAWKSEGVGDIVVRAPKVYRWRDKLRIKGAARERPETLEELFAGRPGRVAKIPTIREILVGKAEAMLIDRKYELRYERVKRCFGDDGWSRPFLADEIFSGRYIERRKGRKLDALYFDQKLIAARQKLTTILAGHRGAEFQGEAYDASLGPLGGLQGIRTLPGWVWLGRVKSAVSGAVSGGFIAPDGIERSRRGWRISYGEYKKGV